jgi:hypothetical protein
MACCRTGEDVEHRLGADDLRGGRHQRRITQVFAYPRHFGQYVVHAVQRSLLAQLVGKVGDHAAGDLIDLHPGVDTGEFTFEATVFPAHFVEIHADLLQVG